MKIVSKLGIEFNKHVKNASNLKIISPYMGSKPTDELIELLNDGDFNVKIITRFNSNDFSEGSSDIKSIERLLKSGVEIFAHRNIHGKLYIFDKKAAILGSANFTKPGFGIYGKENVELSIVFDKNDDMGPIKELDEYFEKLYRLCSEEDGSRITPAMIRSAKREVNRIKSKRRKKTTPKFQIGAKGNPWHDEPGQSWLKFEGSYFEPKSGDDVIRKTTLTHWSKETHFSKQPKGIMYGDELFMAVHTADWESPIVVGIVKTHGFNEKNYDSSESEEYPYFVRFIEGKFIDAAVKEGFSLRDNLNLFPGRTARSWAQKSHISLKKNEAEILREKMNEIFNKHGSFEINTEQI